MAELVGLEVPQVEALEAGAVEASTDQLDRYARVFGLSLRRFLAGGAETAPPALLFRSLRSEKPSFEDLLETVGKVADEWDDVLKREFGRG